MSQKYFRTKIIGKLSIHKFRESFELLKQFWQKLSSNSNFNELRISPLVSFICLWLALEKPVFNLI